MQVPNCDVVRLTNDVHEDWLLARHLYGLREEMPDVLLRADQPLWWLRALRLTSQLLLEKGDQAGWRALLSRVEAADDLDPAWSRIILIAPLYSERSQVILDELEPALLDADAQLLTRLLDTLIVFETQLNDRILKHLADRDETTRYAIAGYLKIPVFRSWGAFLRGLCQNGPMAASRSFLGWWNSLQSSQVRPLGSPIRCPAESPSRCMTGLWKLRMLVAQKIGTSGASHSIPSCPITGRGRMWRGVRAPYWWLRSTSAPTTMARYLTLLHSRASFTRLSSQTAGAAGASPFCHSGGMDRDVSRAVCTATRATRS